MGDLASSLVPVKHRRAFEDIVVQIENAIHDGELKVGDKLPPERELAEIFRVSRASVREALRVLEAFGVLTARRGTGSDSGLIVSAHNDSPLSGLLRLYASLLQLPLIDLLDVREALEMLSARRASEQCSAEDIFRLRGIIQSMRDSRSPEGFLTLDTEFHVVLARASGNSVAPLIMSALRDAIARQMLAAFQALEESGNWRAERALLIREHAHLLDAVESRDPDAAAGAFQQHIRDFYQRVFVERGTSAEESSGTPE
ncbi:FadR/GntR family transcriptional regulator [Pseudonocardia sulfidoxydans]|nr:FadR/GntR family transcriptional regulator [Pseudonocardia sulfidoxydans]